MKINRWFVDTGRVHFVDDTLHKEVVMEPGKDYKITTFAAIVSGKFQHYLTKWNVFYIKVDGTDIEMDVIQDVAEIGKIFKIECVECHSTFDTNVVGDYSGYKCAYCKKYNKGGINIEIDTIQSATKI